MSAFRSASSRERTSWTLQATRYQVPSHTHRPGWSLVGQLQIYLYIDLHQPFSRWPKAILLVNISAETVCRVLISGWTSRFRVLSRITTDRGRQLEACLFRELSRLLGVQHIRTTSYHPVANGIVKRFHRQLEAAICTVPDPHRWSEFLPIVLLGCRSAVNEDLGYSSAEFLYGTTCTNVGAYRLTECGPHILRHATLVILCRPVTNASS
ncbi:uncharacterized protein LOC115230689 [Octopus sinensis]|uniref:Uncharacterized protein LOC115230689 n=1 Tax=Octopus sinensis TaxID=2607531 RepID=A0A6P7U6W1_9MOLL|nr:uncharacterized protein LOC115230689 [Octopus sinensis]